MIIYGGQEISRLEKSLPDSTERGLNVYQKLRKKLNDYFIPKRNKHYSRYMFLKMRPQMGESTVAYATRLREKAHNCEFGNTQANDERILEHLIQTIENKMLIQKCISKAWTLQEFLTEAGQIEDILLQMRDMSVSPYEQAISKIEDTRRKSKKPQRYSSENSRRSRDENCPNCGFEVHAEGNVCPA